MKHLGLKEREYDLVTYFELHLYLLDLSGKLQKKGVYV